MCRNSSDRGLSLRNGWISNPIQGWNERKDLAKTEWFHGIPGLFWVFADQGDYKTAINAGFRILAGYIFGGNTRLESIDMTAPVMERESESIAMTAPVTEQQTGEFRRISFMMPGKYTLDTLPKPDDKRIRFKEILEKKYAVIRFTWYPTGPRVESKKAELAELIQSLGYIPKGEPVFAAYNDPFSFPLLKRNEILIEVE